MERTQILMEVEEEKAENLGTAGWRSAAPSIILSASAVRRPLTGQGQAWLREYRSFLFQLALFPATAWRSPCSLTCLRCAVTYHASEKELALHNAPALDATRAATSMKCSAGLVIPACSTMQATTKRSSSSNDELHKSSQGFLILYPT